MSLDENLVDLERHARDFAERGGFTYSVLDPEGDVIGCVYIYPAETTTHDVARALLGAGVAGRARHAAPRRRSRAGS